MAPAAGAAPHVVQHGGSISTTLASRGGQDVAVRSRRESYGFSAPRRPSFVARSTRMATGPHRVTAARRAVAAGGGFAYVTNGGLHQFELRSNGPVFRHSLPTNGPSSALALVQSTEDGHVRLGVTGAHTLTVFAAPGTDPPTQTSVRAFPSGPLPTTVGPPIALGDDAVVGFFSAGLMAWRRTEFGDPLDLATVYASDSRHLVMDFVRHGERLLVLYNEQPLAGATSAFVAEVDDTGGKRHLVERMIGPWARDLVIAGDRAYVPVSQGDQGTADSIVTLALDDPTLPIVSREPYAPLSAATGGFGLGVEGELLRVTDLADPDHPRPSASVGLTGRAIDVEAVAGGSTPLGSASAALVLVESGGHAWLETFMLSRDQPPFRVRGPVFVPDHADDVASTNWSFLPVALFTE